ncbi:hypothetical protein PSN45_001654 [Yamadazyma tenuis]|uniref:Uncharacterized protein n=1 Tax=Candida tenuis (strain ATCC 10573 / BCRC 21748 / CBS 615 / JCM 9827 / NBRC 10315 / NRRL Y-1498 / VKM Y-70) TaxID=590646 RepID=G3BER9_CANTC|nr:uncharacterized protein CANTEDRAFT_96026 [Yamadazyma tenuis ATCC 10573]EGV60578.1 hypothetical protein CANTEDRAFT_96026 [Yamadazyma tenuis ATCC 10573]WEJ94174.1 hypothetical protein PSN45_001654 [Yamadazyma tenuis]
MLRSSFLLTPKRVALAATKLSGYSLSRAYTASNHVAFYATSSNNEEVEYEIDIITLTKTPKNKPSKTSINDLVNLKLINSSNIDKALVEQSINQVNQSLDEDLNKFVLRYSVELNDFLQFIRSSYENKIHNFNQLTSVEILNSLYIFKDFYLKNKIPKITRYNYISYNYMFDNFLKCLKKFPNLPEILNDLLLLNNQGIDLLNLGISKYVEDLEILNRRLDLSDHSLTFDDFIREIQKTINFYEFNLDSFGRSKVFTEPFYESFIQANRLKNLKSILTKVPNIEPVDLGCLIKNKHFLKIVESLNADAASSQSSKSVNLKFLKFIIPDSDSNYLQIISALNQLKSQNGANKIPLVDTMHSSLVAMSCSGSIYPYHKPLNFPLTQFKISNDLVRNFEFSMVFDHKLFLYIDELKALNSMGIDLSSADAVNKIGGLKFKSDLLAMNFKSLATQLSEFFKSVTTENTDCLFKLVENKNWMDWCQENYHSRIPRLLVDYSNLSDYPYKSIKISTELSRLLPALSKFSFENDINLSCLSLDYLLSIFKDSTVGSEVLRKLYLNHGNVYLQNLQGLLEDFNNLQFTLLKFDLPKVKATEGKDFKDFTQFELEKHFGYISTLINDPLILDNLDQLYRENSPLNSIDAKQVLTQLSAFKYELEILKVDELQNNFANITSDELLFKLDRRIKEILSNLNSNPQSRLGPTNVIKFIELQKLLTKLFTVQDDCSELDKFIEYRQIPERFNLHDSSPDLFKIHQFIGKNYKDCSMGEILEAVNNYTESLPESSTFDRQRFFRLSIKMKQLFRLTGGFTDVLDSIIANQVEFEKLESKLLSSKRRKFEAKPLIVKIVKDIPESAKPKKTYVQIPDDLKIHEFAKELNSLKVFEFEGKELGSFTPSEIQTLLDERINQFLDGSVSPDCYINDSNVECYSKLSSKLGHLFAVNGGHTDVLDAIINSELVFESFEKRMARKEKTYRPLPDDFRLQEFVPEIQQVQSELEKQTKAQITNFKFSEVDSSEVLKALSSMIENEKRFNLTKRENFAKLLKNLKVLFNYNGDNTSVLDNILINHEVLTQVASKPKAQVKSDMSAFVDSYKEYLPQFFATGFKNYDLVNFYDLSSEDFSNKVKSFISHIKKDFKYQYPTYKDFTEKLVALYEQDPINLAILFKVNEAEGHPDIYAVKKEVSTFMDKLSKNKDLYSKEDPEPGVQFQKSTEVPYEKFNIHDFKSKSEPKVQEFKRSIEVPVEKLDTNDLYLKDSESNVQQKSIEVPLEESCNHDVKSTPVNGEDVNYNHGTSKFNIKESTMEDSELFVRNQIFHQVENKTGSAGDFEDLLKMTPEEIRSTYHAKAKLDKLNIQNYLENVNEQKKLRDEEEFRQLKAFEWSNNKSRSLDAKTFFDPWSERSQDHLQYLILTMDGEKIITEENPLGKEQFEDLLAVFDRFNEAEMSKFIKNINRLQQKSWKLIGGGAGNYGKMLVFTKSKSKSSMRGIFRKIQTVLAATGATFMVLIGLNYWLDAPQTQTISVPPKEEVAEKVIVSAEPLSQTQDGVESQSQAGWFWK